MATTPKQRVSGKGPKRAKTRKPAVVRPRPTQDMMDQFLAKAEALIESHGWMVQAVMTSPLVLYTVGLTRNHGLPEIVVTGLGYEDGTQILNDVATQMTEKTLVLAESAVYNTVFSGFGARFKKLSPAQASLLKIAAIFSPTGHSVDAWQLLWPDPDGFFLDEPGVNPKYAAMQNLPLVLSEGATADAH